MMKMGNITVSFIILTWNSEAYLERCFNSIIRKCSAEGIPFEAIVIDNGSQDRSVEIVKEYRDAHPGIFHLISFNHNCGTTFPRNQGMKKAQGQFFCILDSDTELGIGSLASILARLHKEYNIGIIAPRLILPDGRVQNSVKKFPTMFNKLIKIPRIIMGIETRNADYYDDFPFVNERKVDTAISACWFFRRELLEKVGYLDEKIFYAPEDIDYSLRVCEAGLGILYDPTFNVLHHTQQITHKKPLSMTSLSHFKGLLYYYWKHGGWLIPPRNRNDS